MGRSDWGKGFRGHGQGGGKGGEYGGGGKYRGGGQGDKGSKGGNYGGGGKGDKGCKGGKDGKKPNLPKPWQMAKPEKTEVQKAKERWALHNCTLCIHNLGGKGLCQPKDGRDCTFAHWLSELEAPEESEGYWSKIWKAGNVDITFWDTYRPNVKGLWRFKTQFNYERTANREGIPDWCWDLAFN